MRIDGVCSLASGYARRDNAEFRCAAVQTGAGFAGRAAADNTGTYPTEEAAMPDRARGQGSPAALRPDEPLRGRRLDLVPAGRPLPRQRLQTALSQAVDRAPVTLVSGPAGSGKTVLAATWARRAADSTAG